MAKKKVSGGKVLLALCTGGLSLPFVGLKKNGKKKHTAPATKTKSLATPSKAEIQDLKSRCNIRGDFRSIKTDLAESSDIAACCPKCAMYRRRIFSLTGKDKRFPKLPNDFNSNCCGLSLWLFDDSIMEPTFSAKNPIKYSNRPFVDDRTSKERQDYQNILEEKAAAIQKEKDKDIYKKLVAKLPNDAPKSFSAFRRMKNSNSASYIELKRKASLLGIQL